jgi:hypothetical protein
MAVKSKPFWQSTTLWINVIGIVATVLTLVSGMTKDADIVAILLAIANILNRFRNIPAEKLTIK